MPQDKTFVVLVVLISLAFVWILWPFYGAIFWATMLAILFGPMFRRLALSGRTRRTPAGPRGPIPSSFECLMQSPLMIGEGVNRRTISEAKGF